MSKVYAYLRLSRDEAENPGLLEEKFERHKGTALDLAKRYELDLPESHIVIEQESGKALKNRPKLLHLLDLAHAGMLTHLIATAQDRVDRLEDKRDQAELEDAMYAGGVTLVTLEGLTRYDEHLDPLPADLRALIARHELRLYSRRRKEANRQRLAKNQAHGGFAPYGYRRNKEAIESGGYEIVPEEYIVLQEIFNRILFNKESINSILEDLNARMIPPPGATRIPNPADDWAHSTLSRIVFNPIYAGYHARQSKDVRGKGRRVLKKSDYELSTGPSGTWPCPITMSQWYEIQNRFNEFSEARGSVGLLTGILRCPDGNVMRANTLRAYRCTCPGRNHATAREKWDLLIVRVIREFIARIPDNFLDRPIDRIRNDSDQVLQAQLQRAIHEHGRKRDELKEFARQVADPTSALKHFDPALLAQMINDMQSAESRLKTDVEKLRAICAAPKLDQVSTLLSEIRKRGIDEYIDSATREQIRQMIRIIFERISLTVNAGKMHHYRRADLKWNQWVIDMGLQIDIPDDWWNVLHRRTLPRGVDQ